MTGLRTLEVSAHGCECSLNHGTDSLDTDRTTRVLAPSQIRSFHRSPPRRRFFCRRGRQPQPAKQAAPRQR